MRKILPIVLVLFGVIILAGAGAYLWHLSLPVPAADSSTVPQTVAGVAQTQLITGAEAITSINQLHGKEFPLTGGAVAVYGSQNVTLWVSGTADEASARELTDLMVARIAEGNSPFTDEGVLEIGGYSIYALTGLGQDHYYWQSRNLVLWVAADADLSSQALHDLVTFYK